MKNLSILLLLIPCLVISQEIFQKEITYTNTLSFSEIIQLPDNGYMACGWTKTSTIDSTYAIIARMDSSMQVQWCKRYTTLARDDFRCIEALSDGNFLVGGTGRQEFSSFYGGTLFKMDGSGNVIWHKLYSNVYDDAALGVFEQPDNTIVLFVRYGVTGQPTKILKVDASGNLISEIELYTTNVTPGIVGSCVTSDGSGSYFLGGTALNSTTGKHMHYIMKTSDDEVIWYNEYDFGRESAYLYSITMLNDGNIAITGNVVDATNTDLSNIAVMKIDQGTGSVIWTKEIKQTDDFYQTGLSIGSLQNNEIMVCGRANTIAGYQAIAVKLNPDGDFIWAREYGDGPYESLGFLNEVSGNRYLFGGKMSFADGPYFVQTDTSGYSACLTENFDFTAYNLSVDIYSPQTSVDDPNVEPMSPTYEETSLTLSLNTICLGSITGQEISKSTYARVYPNPASKFITIELTEGNSTGNSIEIHNIHGELIYRSVMHNQKKVIETSFNSGLYFLTIRNSEAHSFYRQKFVVR